MGQALSVLDAQAMVALITDEAAAGEVEALLRDRLSPPSINALNLAEVIDVLVRIHGHLDDDVIERLAWLEVDGMEVAAVDGVIGQRAGTLRARHYRRSSSQVSMADCVALATALAANDVLATSDPALAAAARAEGCLVVALPDSRGRRP